MLRVVGIPVWVLTFRKIVPMEWVEWKHLIVYRELCHYAWNVLSTCWYTKKKKKKDRPNNTVVDFTFKCRWSWSYLSPWVVNEYPAVLGYTEFVSMSVCLCGEGRVWGFRQPWALPPGTFTVVLQPCMYIILLFGCQGQLWIVVFINI